MKTCELCGRKLGARGDGGYICKKCLAKCARCGKKKGTDFRHGLCDECWKAEIETRGYDPESYVGTWFDVLKSDEIVGKHVSAIKMPVRPDKGRGRDVSDLLGIIAGHTIGIGWMSVELSQGLILLKDYPIEIIRIEDEKKTYERDDVYTAKVLFYSPIERCARPRGWLMTPGVKLGGIAAKWKGIISKKFDGISVASLLLQEDKILDDRELVENLHYLFRDVTCEFCHDCRWMGPKVDDVFSMRMTIRDIQEKKYLEISTRTVRFTAGARLIAGVRISYKRTSEEEYEYWQRAIRTLLCSVAKIAEYARASLSE